MVSEQSLTKSETYSTIPFSKDVRYQESSNNTVDIDTAGKGKAKQLPAHQYKDNEMVLSDTSLVIYDYFAKGTGVEYGLGNYQTDRDGRLISCITQYWL